MYKKRGRAKDENPAPPAKRLRQNIADLYLSNDISASRAQELYEDAVAAGTAHVNDLARVGQGGRLFKNLARDLKAKLLKGSRWPKPYMAKVRMWDPKRSEEVLSDMAFLLPHEIMWAMLEDGATQQFLLGQQKLPSTDAIHVSTVCDELGADRMKTLGVALWGDGIPFNYDRSASLDVFSLSLPGFEGTKFSTMRIPLFAMDHKHVIKGSTFDDLMAVLAWSFTHLATGIKPGARHDGTPFHPRSDRSRLPKEGPSYVGFHGILMECRGDWKQLKDVFRFPQFNEVAGMCWLCACTPATWRLTGPDAPWRNQRLTHWGFVARLRSRGLSPSPLFATPGLRTQCFKPDWLHVCDLGVTSDFLGNFLLLVSQKLPGASHKSRVEAMWKDIQAWYKRHGVENRLDNLCPSMLQGSSTKPPKLRAKAAQARSLVPYAVYAADSFLAGSDVEAAAKAMANQLAACYECLSPDKFDHGKLAHHCRRFCGLAVAMEERHDGILWRCKPKIHLFQELAEFLVDCPSLFWTYRDEDFGGSMAQLARKRGGPATSGSISKNVLLRHCAKHKLPSV